MKFSLIVACDNQNGIGKDNALPWKFKEDMEFFKNMTRGKKDNKNVLVMGSNTFESIQRKSLGHDRLTIVITSDKSKYSSIVSDDIIFTDRINPHSIRELILKNFYDYAVEEVFYCGGEKIYKELEKYTVLLDNIFVTHIDAVYDCDTKINLSAFTKSKIKQDYYWTTSHGVKLSFVNYISYFTTMEEENSYLRLCKKILIEGENRDDRTGVGTLAVFGERLEFSLVKNVIPILTTKKVAVKSVIKELLWFISGSTDSNLLEKDGVKIWKGNTTREFLDKRGLTDLNEGDIGAGYGFQWRHYGAEYKGMQEDYENQGIDQLAEVVSLIKNDPFSRRILFTGWNPVALNRMALPPCHMMAQFFVSSHGTLSCQMYQRSADMFLGVPFNIMSYALLTCLIAHVCDLKPHKLTMCFGDTHIYKNHIDQVMTQLSRTCYEFPKLELNNDVKNLFDFKFEDIVIKNYKSHEGIKAPMAV